ncbi:MAG: hypothetical protein GF398_00125 [Chitinivibrionales bacterium]|nr:hypothetical protein [Chitinivibrionales bacterium]
MLLLHAVSAQSRVRKYLSFLTVITITFLTASTLHAFDGKAYFYQTRKPVSLVEVDMATGNKRTVFSSSENLGSPAKLSPDGRYLGYVTNNRLHLVDIDAGTDRVEFEGLNNDEYHWAWTTNGIFWDAGASGGTGIYRYDFDTKQKTIVHRWIEDDYRTSEYSKYVNDHNDRVRTGGGHYVASLDGRIAWARVSTPMKDAQNEGCFKDYNHHFLYFNEDFSSVVDVPHCSWGHGRGMTNDGKYMLFMIGFGCYWEIADEYTGDKSHESGKGSSCGNHRCWKALRTSDLKLEFDLAPPNNTDYITDDAVRCSNDNDYLGYSVKSEPGHYIWNWKENTAPVNFVDLADYRFLGFWKGDRPSSNEPYLAVSPMTLSFSVDNGASSVADKDVTVTNSSAGTLTKVSASSSEPWLTVSVQGSGGNTQQITNSIDVSALSSGENTATVTVSSGGASNSVEYSVVATKGGIPAPSDLATSVPQSDSLLDVRLTWTDNADNETGYIIERKPEGGSWQAIKTVNANTEAYTDEHLAIGTYVYRVKAETGSQYSSYSNESSIAIEGIMWVRVTGPTKTHLDVGETVKITWETNRVDNIKILYTADGGDNWDLLTATGGITSTMNEWDDGFEWTVPASLDGKVVVIQVAEYNDIVSGFSSTVGVGSTSATNPHLRAGSMLPVAVELQNRRLVVSGSSNRLVSVHMASVNGKQVLSADLRPADAQAFSLKKMPKGIYTLTLIHAGTVDSRRIVLR